MEYHIAGVTFRPRTKSKFIFHRPRLIRSASAISPSQDRPIWTGPRSWHIEY